MASPSAEPADTALVAYLNSLDIAAKDVSRLAGGRANHIWRVTIDATTPAAKQLSLPGSIIVKHAQPFVASNPSIPFAVDRMAFEARALSRFQALPNIHQITVPTLYHHDEVQHMLLMSDAGQHNLKDSYSLLSKDEVQNIGLSLGKWLAALHSQTRELDIRPGGNKTAKSIYRYAYAELHRSIKRWNLQDEFPGMAHEVNSIYGAKLETDDECVCMGDFWTGNIVIEDDTVARTARRCTLVDWEMVRRGCGATDVGQFLAEAFLLDKFRSPSKDLAGTFYKSYIRHYGAQEVITPSAEYLRRIGVHCGLHLGFWPTYIKWADDEETRRVVTLGLRLITVALDEVESPQAWYTLLISEEL